MNGRACACETIPRRVGWKPDHGVQRAAVRPSSIRHGRGRAPGLLLAGLALLALAAGWLLTRGGAPTPPAPSAAPTVRSQSGGTLELSIARFVQAFNECRPADTAPMVNTGGSLGVDGAFDGTLSIDGSLSGRYTATVDNRLISIELEGRGDGEETLAAFRAAVSAATGADDRTAGALVDGALARARTDIPGSGSGSATVAGCTILLTVRSATRLSLKIQAE